VQLILTLKAFKGEMVQAFEYVETDMNSYEGITLSCMEIPTGPDLAWQWV